MSEKLVYADEYRKGMRLCKSGKPFPFASKNYGLMDGWKWQKYLQKPRKRNINPTTNSR